MGEFRIGRTRAQHTYPEPRSAGALGVFARNFAKGPGTEGAQFVSTAGTQISWGTIDAPGLNTEDVPITPRSTGVVRVLGVVSVQNSTANPATVIVQVQVDSVTVTTPSPQVTIDPANTSEETNGFEAIPFLVELVGLTIGTTVNVEVLVTALTADAVSMPSNDSTIEVFEVPVATG